jgi:hypothetical protein
VTPQEKDQIRADYAEQVRTYASSELLLEQRRLEAAASKPNLDPESQAMTSALNEAVAAEIARRGL